MEAKTFRLWAVEHLVRWPNRLHVLLVVLVPIVVVSDGFAFRFTWFGLLLVVAVVGSFVFRVWRWDHHRLPGASDDGGSSSQPAVSVESTP